MLVDGRPVSASLFDLALYLRWNGRESVARGSGPYVYLAKLEGRSEAELWNDVFVAAQEAVGLPRGTIRATVLIETITASFEMEEILFALREHSAGLNAGAGTTSSAPSRSSATIRRSCCPTVSL